MKPDDIENVWPILLNQKPKPEIPEGWERINCPELNEMFKAMNESGDDYNRIYVTAMVGSNEEPHGIHCLTVERGLPDGRLWPNGDPTGDGLREHYQTLREVLMNGTPANPPYFARIEGRDIGPIEDAWFVICDDCGVLDPPIIRDANSYPIGDEWNALMNLHIDNERTREVWRRKKISFQELHARIAAMVQEPPDPNQTYRWHDRVD
jgi:hypothetical protein